MRVPEGMTKEEVEQVIQDVMKVIKNKFHYGFDIHDPDDIHQEAYFVCLDVLQKYKGDRGKLFNFLCVAVKNRFKNFVRDKSRVISAEFIEYNNVIDVRTIANMYNLTEDEFWNCINEGLTPKERKYFLEFIDGVHIKKWQRLQMFRAIRRVIEGIASEE